MRKIKQKASFKKDLKLCIRRGKKIQKLKDIVEFLANDGELAQKYKDHTLTGNWAGFRDCHIEPDWVLIYRKIDDDLLELVKTGTHSDLF